MIHQRFIPISPLLNAIQKQCIPGAEPYFHAQYSLDAGIVTENIFKSEEILFSILEKLSMFTTESDILQYMQKLPPDHLFLLNAVIQIAFLHFHADTELLPAIPPDKIYTLLFAYLQEGYLAFKTHCLHLGLNIWDEILNYECDLCMPPSI